MRFSVPGTQGNRAFSAPASDGTVFRLKEHLGKGQLADKQVAELEPTSRTSGTNARSI